jgi:hypothetical protein
MYLLHDVLSTIINEHIHRGTEKSFCFLTPSHQLGIDSCVRPDVAGDQQRDIIIGYAAAAAAAAPAQHDGKPATATLDDEDRLGLANHPAAQHPGGLCRLLVPPAIFCSSIRVQAGWCQCSALVVDSVTTGLLVTAFGSDIIPTLIR